MSKKEVNRIFEEVDCLCKSDKYNVLFLFVSSTFILYDDNSGQYELDAVPLRKSMNDIIKEVGCTEDDIFNDVEETAWNIVKYAKGIEENEGC